MLNFNLPGIIDFGSEQETNDQTLPSMSRTWLIRNKYYTAPVTLKLIESIQDIEQDGEAPAVIIIVSRDQVRSLSLLCFSASYSHISALFQKAPASHATLLNEINSKRQDEGFEVALLVTIDPSNHVETIDDVAWEDLAIDQQFEWIDTGLRNVNHEEANSEEGEEKFGVARVVEALHSHLWEGMERLEQLRSKLRNDDQIQEEYAGREAEREGKEIQAMGAPPLPSPRPFVPVQLSFPSTFLPSLNRPASSASLNVTSETTDQNFDDDFSPFVSATTTSLSIRAAQKLPPLPSSLNFTESNNFLLLDEEEDDRAGRNDDGMSRQERDEDEHLSTMFSQLSGWREEAKGLGMEERRRFAEKVLQELTLD